MAELLVKTVYAIFAFKYFHICDINILVPVHANSIDRIYTALGGPVV